uniref:DUF4244 domain-containing protein n=1 Tax=Heterorhabditis bacteriophora TaxID=37862 RepID=A0A1I7XC11_HETBA
MASLKAWISGFSTVLTSLAYAVVNITDAVPEVVDTLL